MAKKKIKWLLFILGLFVVIGSTVLAREVIADFGDSLSYAKYKNNLRDFTSKVFFQDDRFGLSAEMLYLINSFVQAGFWITKFIFTICAGAYELLSSSEGIEKYIHEAMSWSADFFHRLLFDNSLGIGATLVGLLGVYGGYVYFVKNGSFVRTIVRFFLLLVFVFTFYSRDSSGQYFVERFYNEARQTGVQMMASVSFMRKLPEQSDEEVILNTYFKKAIWEPYRYLNADIGDNGKDSNGFVMSDLDLIALLSYNSGDEKFKIDDVPIKEIAGTIEDPKNSMLKDNWGMKFIVVVSSWFEVIGLGLILLFFSFASFVLSVMFLIFTYLSPIGALIGLAPFFELVFLNISKRIIGIVFVSSLLGFLTALSLFLYTQMSEMLAMVVGSNFALQSFLKLVCLGAIWWKRDYFISILTSNRLTTRLSSSLANRFSRSGYRIASKGLEPIKRNMQGIMALAGHGLEAKVKSGYRAFSGFSKSMLHSNQQSRAHRYAEQKASQGGDYDSAYREYQKQREDDMLTRFKPIKDIRDKAQSAYHQSKAKSYQYQAEHYKFKNDGQYEKMKSNEQYHQNQANDIKDEIKKRSEVKQRYNGFGADVKSDPKPGKKFNYSSRFKSDDSKQNQDSLFETKDNIQTKAVTKPSFRPFKNIKIPQRKQIDK